MKGLLSEIGTCGYCIRTAFRLAGAAFVSAGIAWLSGNSLALLLTVTASVLCASLWLLHVIVFAFRSAKRETGSQSDSRLSQRREFMRSFIRAGAGMAALTVIGAVTTQAALAQDGDSADRKRANDCRNAKYRCGNQCLTEYNNCMNGCQAQSGFGAIQCIGQCSNDKDSCNSQCEDQESDCNNG